MQFLKRYLVLICLAFGLSACLPRAFPNQSIFPDDVQAAFTDLQIAMESQNLETVQPLILQEVQDLEEFEVSLTKVLNIIPENFSDYEMIFAENRQSDDSAESFPIYFGVYEFPWKNEFVLLQLVLDNQSGACCLARHFKSNSYTESPSLRHEFSAPPKSFLRIGFIALMAATLAFILTTIFFIVRDKPLKNKWLWVIFTLFGTYGLLLNWTTGGIGLNFLSLTEGNFSFKVIKFNLLGGGYQRASVYQPWMLDWGFPLGAVLYWFKRRRRRKDMENPFA